MPLTPLHKRSVHGHHRQRIKRFTPTRMRTIATEIRNEHLALIPGTRALIWGNNAAWVCPQCGELNGGRTGNTELHVTCPCTATFTILRVRSRQGAYHLGAAAGVQLGTTEGNITAETWHQWNY